MFLFFFLVEVEELQACTHLKRSRLDAREACQPDA